jgi:phosphate transport system substrate-binding protein
MKSRVSTQNVVRWMASMALLVLAGGAALWAQSAIELTGAGATFPYPVYSKWFDEYHKLNPSVQFNYQSIGSGGGIRQITEGTVAFGASDGPMTEEQLKAYQDKNGHGILHFPTVLGAVVVTYNIPGYSGQLNFTPEMLAGIYLGKITRWNDPAIKSANPSANLPGNEIVVVHRSDGSGTTYIWTDYLSKVSDEWRNRVGKSTSVNWPLGLGGKGNEGVSGLVKQTPNAVGYVELIYALQNKMDYGKVRNAAGKFIVPSLKSVTAAAAGAAKDMPEDFRVSITNAPGADAYPISSFTWLLVPNRINDPQKKRAMLDFLNWMVGPGQKLAEPLAYAALPSQVVAMEKKAFSRIQ